MRLPEVGATLDLSQKLDLRARLEALRNAHTTALVLSEAQSEPVLDLAAQADLSALIELVIDPSELTGADAIRGALSRVSHAANAWRNHPALIGYLIDCPLASAQLKEFGLTRLQRGLRRLVRAIRLRDARALVALRHRPQTLALAMPVEDFLYASVEGLAPAELARFVVALHNLAMARPVVIEFPMAAADQDELVATAFGVGAAGVIAPLVQRGTASSGLLGLKMLRADEATPFLVLNGSVPPAPARRPMVSVVICAYNAERTMRACLESLTRLRYPNYEVVIVDDGSRDRTAEIAMEFPQFRLIRQPNKGLSVARNVGLHAAHGEIVAYTDSDCVVDPDWLTLMVRAIVEDSLDGCGGPNYAPHEEGRIEACVAASPGAPCHVLTADDRAEHLAGCNMAFSKPALVALGGFDPQFTAAGDDVDMCWRLLDAGYRLGYCPSAFVWHFRRNTIRAYYGQQRGYGRAEAMLYLKYPERFNALGQIKWRGIIPGLAATVPGAGRPRIGWTHAAAGWQTIKERPPGIANFLPQTLEWHLLWSAAAALMWLGGLSALPALAMLGMGPLWALYYAARAPLEQCHDTWRARLLVAALAWSGPMARTWARWKTRLGAGGAAGGEAQPRQRPSLRLRARALGLSYWNEAWTTREALLERLARHLSRAGAAVITDSGWNDFDLEARPGPWTRLRFKTADEEHEGARLRNHVAVRVRLSWLSRAGLLTAAVAAALGIALGQPLVAAALTAMTIAGALFVAADAIESARLAWLAVEQSAHELNLTPLGKPTAAARRAAAAAARPSAAAARPLATPAKLLVDNQTLAD